MVGSVCDVCLCLFVSNVTQTITCVLISQIFISDELRDQ